MKPSQEPELRIALKPELSRRLAAEATDNLSDEQAVNRADEIQRVLTPLMARLQALYLTNARSEHETSDERQLIVDHGKELVETLQSAIDTLVIPQSTLDLLRRVLCASELLIYPCVEFSETLSAREIVARGSYLAEQIAQAEAQNKQIIITEDLAEALRDLSRDDIAALRISTPEYLVQVKIFDLLRQYCSILSEKFRVRGEKGAALEALGLVQLLDSGKKLWFECLSECSAADFVDGLESLIERYRRETGETEVRG